MTKSVKDLGQLAQLVEGIELPEGEPEYKTSYKTELVTKMAYLLGLQEDHFDEWFGKDNPEIAMELKGDPKANIIRNLCMLRNTLLNNYQATEREIVYNLNNIDSQPWYDQKAIQELEKVKIHAKVAGYRADDYSVYFTKLIAEHIGDCKHLFPEWVNFAYVSDLFYHPSYAGNGTLKKEFQLYHENRNFYPYHLYMHWKPEDVGNFLISDGKFLKSMYWQHGKEFTDSSKYRDAVDHTKKSIYECIDHSDKTVIVVDCENSDVFKLYGTLKNLNQEEVSKVEKIILYDDYHTTSAWTWLKHFVSIPIEYVDVERVTDRKSLVDIKMTAGICKAFYKDDIDTFILCSSDSDFWGVISSLPDANFLVMYEYSKAGQAIKEALDTRGIFHCSMDDFYTGNAMDLQKAVLLHELKERANDCLGQSPMKITKDLYFSTRITAKDSEMEHFCNKYVKTMRLKLDKEGNFFIDVPEA